MADRHNRLVSSALTNVTDPGDFDIGADFVDSNIGAVLEDRYLLVRTIGSGGMGIVYEAQHQSVRSRHAIKILHKHLMQRQDVVRRFLNEARAAGSLGHPNIVKSTDMGKTPEGIPFVVFEYLDGVTLKEEMVDVGMMPLGRVLDVVIQVVSALERAHQQKIIHRDVKPENIFILRAEGGREQVKLLDFGIAKFSSATTTLTSDGKIFGSPQYMSPEQLRDAASVDARTDVYAVGVLLFELTAGRAPFAGQEGLSLVARARGGGVQSLAAAAPDAPASLVAVVDRALSVNPDDRPESMTEMRRDLERCREELASGVTAKAPGWWKKRGVLPVAAVAGTLAAAVALYFALASSPDRPATRPGAVAKPAATTTVTAKAPPVVPVAPVPSAAPDAGAAVVAAPASSSTESRARARAQRHRAARLRNPTPANGDGPPMFTAPPK